MYVWERKYELAFWDIHRPKGNWTKLNCKKITECALNIAAVQKYASVASLVTDFMEWKLCVM